ncbi:MAG: chromate transporter [Synergistaceae bacterium]|jgi:chromate transporter|nr:chromate transporter [Synergistaceae bacterium]
MVYASLIFEFLKIGVFSIGGGLATLPFLYDLADKYDWFTRETLIDMIAVSESTPGPIGLNMATYAGYAAGGVPGGVAATLSLITPSFFFIILIVKILDKFKENKLVKSAFYGIRPAVTALIASAAIEILRIALFRTQDFIDTKNLSDILKYGNVALFIIIFYLIRKLGGHPVFYICGAAVFGYLLNL